MLHELGVRHEDRIRFIVLDKEEVAALLRNVNALDGMTCGVLSMACIIGLLYCCGLRIGEALALSIEDFDYELSTLFIKRGKFGKQRIAPLSPSARDAVATYLSSRRLPAVSPQLHIMQNFTLLTHYEKTPGPGNLGTLKKGEWRIIRKWRERSPGAISSGL